ncbi:MAG: hypothetical protein ACXWZY_02285 [Gaiellaceae bacterium]
MFVPTNDRHVPDSQVQGRLRGAVVVTAENDFHVGPEPRPALDRIALDHTGVADESLRDGEEGEEGRVSSLT